MFNLLGSNPLVFSLNLDQSLHWLHTLPSSIWSQTNKSLVFFDGINNDSGLIDFEWVVGNYFPPGDKGRNTCPPNARSVKLMHFYKLPNRYHFTLNTFFSIMKPYCPPIENYGEVTIWLSEGNAMGSYVADSPRIAIRLFTKPQTDKK